MVYGGKMDRADVIILGGGLVGLTLAIALDRHGLSSIVIDPADHHVTHFLLEAGHLWGHREVAIPIGAVDRLDDGVRLSLTKDQVRDLPTVGVRHG